MKNDSTKLRIVLTILTGLAAVLVFYVASIEWQNQYAIHSMQEEMKENVRLLKENFPNAGLTQTLVEDIHDIVDSTDVFLLHQMAEDDAEFEMTDSYLKSVNENLGVLDIMIADREGNIIASSNGSYSDLRHKVFDPLRTTFETGASSQLYMDPEIQKQKEEQAYELGEYTESQNGEDAALHKLTSSILEGISTENESVLITSALGADGQLPETAGTEAEGIMTAAGTEAEGLLPETAGTEAEGIMTAAGTEADGLLPETAGTEAEGIAETEPPQTEDEVFNESRKDTVLTALRLDDNYELVLSGDRLITGTVADVMNPWKMLLENETIGENGYVFVWDDKTHDLLYYPKDTSDEEDIYVSVDELGLDTDQIRDDQFGWYEIEGEKMYLYPSYYEKEGAWIVCAVSESELIKSRRFTLIFIWIIFILFAVDLVYYIILLFLQKKVKVLTDFTGSGRTGKHISRKYKLFIVTVMVTAILAVAQFYLQTLYLMSNWASSSTRQTSRIKYTVEYNKGMTEIIKEIFELGKKAQLSTFAWMLSRNQDLQTSDILDKYSFILETSDIRILDSSGNSIVTSSYMGYSPDYFSEEDETDVETEDLFAETTNQDKGKSSAEWMASGRRVIIPCKVSGIKNENGYLYMRYYSGLVDILFNNLSLSGTLENVQPGRGGFVFSVDMDTHTFDYYPDHEMQGKDVLERGLKESQLRDNYCDYITINNVDHYATTTVIEDKLLYFVVSRENLLGSRLVNSVITLILAFALFMCIGLPFYIRKEQIEMIAPDEESRHETDESLSPEYKMFHVLMYYAAGVAAVIAMYSVLMGSRANTGVLGYVLEGTWEKALNVFALTSAVIILSKGGAVLFILSKFVNLVADILPTRGGTIVKMLSSLLTYVSIALLIYLCMLQFGLNPTALMASAGIVSVVVGIGANSLVGDILAGIFILMEGNVQVGDVVQIGEFRGYVMELGIRMTKLFDMDTNNVKIIPNNEVRNVVHMTMRVSIVYSDFQIQYEEKLEAVESVLKASLKKAKKSPLILSGPEYIGVYELGENGVTLRTLTRCHEACRKQVEREVNHIVYKIFQENGISVPYPQITMHNGSDEMVEREPAPEDRDKKID